MRCRWNENLKLKATNKTAATATKTPPPHELVSQQWGLICLECSCVLVHSGARQGPGSPLKDSVNIPARIIARERSMQKEKTVSRSPLVATSSTLGVLSFRGKGALLCSQQFTSASHGPQYSSTEGQNFTIFELWSTYYLVQCLKKIWNQTWLKQEHYPRVLVFFHCRKWIKNKINNKKQQQNLIYIES